MQRGKARPRRRGDGHVPSPCSYHILAHSKELTLLLAHRSVVLIRLTEANLRRGYWNGQATVVPECLLQEFTDLLRLFFPLYQSIDSFFHQILHV